MRHVFIATLALCLGIVACKKDKKGKSEYPFVYLNQCFNQTYGNDQVRLCLDEIVSDSRCPTNAFCIWQGAAIAKFSFTKNGTAHTLTLATATLNIPYSRDTIVDGYKISFRNLHPYPELGKPSPPANGINAEVEITKL